MGLDRRLADDERAAAISALRQPCGEQPQHLALARRQLGQRRRARRVADGQPARERVEQPAGDRRREDARRRRRRRAPPRRAPRGGASLSRKPLAPARSAANTYSSRSKVVRIEHARWRRRRRSGGSPRCRPCRACGCPSARRRARRGAPRATASSPSPPRRPPRCRPGSRGSAGSPARTSAWSSASRTRIGSSRRARRAAAWRGRVEAAAGARARPSSAPPYSAARSRIPISPCPRAAAGAVPAPPPSSITSSSSASGRVARRVTARARGAGVLERVGERLLDDPVGGQVELRAPAARGSPSTARRDGEARPRVLLQQPVEVGRGPAAARARPRRRRLARSSERAAHSIAGAQVDSSS